ncbi:MAG: cupin domain-containing protein [bacterium]|nr:cupin domain-containing protein [bacterium]
MTFFRFDEGVTVPDHNHGAQWGYLVTGEMTLEIEGRTELYQAGDVYYIPAGKKHRTSFSQTSHVIDMGDDPHRYPLRGWRSGARKGPERARSGPASVQRPAHAGPSTTSQRSSVPR